MPSLVAGRDVNEGPRPESQARSAAGTPTEEQKRRLLSTSGAVKAQVRSGSSMSDEGHWYGKPRDTAEWDRERERGHLRVQNVQTVVNRGWDQLEPREGVSEEHVKLLLPQERAPQVVDRLVYQEVRPMTTLSAIYGPRTINRC
jgi:hypothetical protein